MKLELTQFDIALALKYYENGLKSFVAGQPLDKNNALSFRSGWKDAKKLSHYFT